MQEPTHSPQRRRERREIQSFVLALRNSAFSAPLRLCGGEFGVSSGRPPPIEKLSNRKLLSRVIGPLSRQIGRQVAAQARSADSLHAVLSDSVPVGAECDAFSGRQRRIDVSRSLTTEEPAAETLQTEPSNPPALGVVFDAVLLARCEQQLARHVDPFARVLIKRRTRFRQCCRRGAQNRPRRSTANPSARRSSNRCTDGGARPGRTYQTCGVRDRAQNEQRAPSMWTEPSVSIQTVRLERQGNRRPMPCVGGVPERRLLPGPSTSGRRFQVRVQRPRGCRTRSGSCPRCRCPRP